MDKHPLEMNNKYDHIISLAKHNRLSAPPSRQEIDRQNTIDVNSLRF